MKFRPFPRQNSDDYRNAESWFLPILDGVNQIVDGLNPMFQNGIDIDNNMLAERQIVTLSHATAVKVKLRKLKITPTLVRVGYAKGFVGTAGITGYTTDGGVMVTVYFSGTPPSGAIPVTLVFEP